MVAPRRLLPLATLVLALAACSTSYTLERHETPVHVWLTAPALARTGGSLQARIQVGPYRVVDAPVTFPQGVPSVELPSLYVPVGSYRVTAEIQGAGRHTSSHTIDRESWLQVVVRGANVGISTSHEEPGR